jgi:hypothetical protein
MGFVRDEEAAAREWGNEGGCTQASNLRGGEGSVSKLAC